MKAGWQEPLDAERLEAILAEVARQILDQGLGAVGSLGQWGCSSITLELCPERVEEVVRAGACRVGVASGATGNPAILVYSTRMAPTERPDIGYAMIFPSMTIVKVIAVQIVGLLAAASAPG